MAGTPESTNIREENLVRKKWIVIGVALSCVIMLGSGIGAAAKAPSEQPTAVLLASGLEGTMGSTVGPGGALYVVEGAAGRVSQVDPQSGAITTFASGLPPAIMPIGGATDVAFIGETAYVLVTMVGSDLDPESNNVVGIYRVDGPDSFTVIADLGAFSIDNPSKSKVFIPSGVHYALDVVDGGFVVTDGHHNRVLHVTLDGEVSEVIAFDNIVPTGLAVWGNTVYVAEAGPNPHLPEHGKVVMFGPESSMATEVASGAPLLVDVEYGRGGKLYALSQGHFTEGNDDGSPADPNTGALVEANADGTFTVITDGLNQPTSLEFIGNTAYIVTLGGEIWMIDGVN
jgi:hypothetical protein